MAAHKMMGRFRILSFLLCSISFWAFDLSAIEYPDLDEIGEDASPNKVSTTPEIKPVPIVSKKEGEDLAQLEKQIRYNESLKENERLRLLSMLQEMQGKYDSAYLTLKKVEGEKGKDWYMMKELYLSDRLGLEEDVEEMSPKVLGRFESNRLKIVKSVFCTSVKSFGVYEKVPKQTLNLGQPVMIYVELTGLKQTLMAGGKYRSGFSGSFDILNQEGQVVYTEKITTKFQYLSNSKLNDYFCWAKWTPKQLKPGRYDLVFRIDDGKKFGQRASKISSFTLL